MPKNYSLDATPANEQRRPKNAMSDEWLKDFLRRAALHPIWAQMKLPSATFTCW